MKDRRFHYVDAARGIAVLLVIYGHTFRESMRAAYAWCAFLPCAFAILPKNSRNFRLIA